MNRAISAIANVRWFKSPLNNWSLILIRIKTVAGDSFYASQDLQAIKFPPTTKNADRRSSVHDRSSAIIIY